MADDPVSAEEVAHRRFSSAFRGFDPNEVRDYLDRVAAELRVLVKRERDLQRRLADAEHRAAHPVIDEDVLTQSLGEETARILASAHDVARELKSRAEENAARILREAHAEARRITASAEVVLAERSEEAEKAAEEIRRATRLEVESAVAKAKQDARAVAAGAEAQASRMMKEAEAASARVAKELARRRRIAHAQVEQLLAGRERLLEAYRVVHRTLEEVGEELQRAEPEAREASEAVARRTGIELDHADDAGRGDHADDSERHVSVSVAADTAVALAHSEPVEPVEPEPDPDPAPDPVVPPVEPQPRHDAVSIHAPAAHVIVENAAAAAAAATEAEAAPPLESENKAERADEIEPVPVPVPDAVQPEPEPVHELEAEADVEPASPPHAEPDLLGHAPSGVAELFARIKAGRSAAVAQAEEVLDGRLEGGHAPADPLLAESTEGKGESESGPVEEPGEEAAVDGDEAALKRRDAALEAVTSRLSRKLKRALQDEQNEVLDGLRSHRGPPSDQLLPSIADQADRYRRTSVDLLEDAAVAGARFMSPGASPAPEVGDVAENLAQNLVGPLRRRLQRGLAGENGDDAAATAERISAAYREWKTQMVDGLARDAIIGAFSRGAAQAAPGALLRWVVDDDGGPCSDCYDNALAGPTASGDTYPTGQVHPPAHAGCRCLLVPANL